MTTLQVLKKVRKLLSDPQNWCGRELALDKDGVPVWPRSRRAKSFCISGALIKFCDLGTGEHTKILTMLQSELFDGGPHIYDEFRNSVIEWNDSPQREHAEVLDLLDRLITKEESKS